MVLCGEIYLKTAAALNKSVLIYCISSLETYLCIRPIFVLPSDEAVYALASMLTQSITHVIVSCLMYLKNDCLSLWLVHMDLVCEKQPLSGTSSVFINS